MKKCLYIPFLGILINSCMNSSSCKQFKFSEADLSWMNSNYQVGDRLLYTSENHSDTLKVIGRTNRFTPCNKFELGPNQYQQFFYTLYSENMNSDSPTVGLIYSTGCNEFGKNKRVFHAFGMYWITDNIKNNKSISGHKIKVKGIKDSIQTLFCDKGNDLLRGKQKMKSFNWNKEHGLVRYITLSGEVYEFVKKI